MSEYEYLTPEEMFKAAEPAPPSVDYYKEKTIPDSMTWQQIRNETDKGRFFVMDNKGDLVLIYCTQYYYTDTGRLKRNKDTGTLVMGPSIEKWVQVA